MSEYIIFSLQHTTWVTFWNFGSKGEFFGVAFWRHREWWALNLAGILEETNREDVAWNSMHTNFVLAWQEIIADFFKFARMPRVKGAVDGSLIPIRAPYNDEHMYVCHKGFHAINAMTVCNAQLSFTNYVCRWQGSVQDSAVFNGSMLHARLEHGGGRNGWLLIDSFQSRWCLCHGMSSVTHHIRACAPNASCNLLSGQAHGD